jgi:hypothetical protein
MRLPVRLAAVLCSTLALASLTQAAEIRLGNRDTPGLIRAVELANAGSERVVVHLEPGGLYTLGEPDAGQALPPVEGRLQIHGNGAEIRRYASGPVTLFEIDARGSLSLHQLTLAEGTHGAIRNHGRLRLEQVNVVDNLADDAQAVIVNFGLFEAWHSDVAHNQTMSGGRDVAVLLNHGTMRLEQVRIQGNSVSRRFPTLVAVAGVLNYGELHIEGVQLDDNSVTDGFDGAMFEGIGLAGNGALKGRLDPLLVKRLDPLPRPFAPMQGWVGR